MKNLFHNRYKAFLLLVYIISFPSCSNFLDREPTDYASVGFYRSEEAIKQGTSGVYEAIDMKGVFAPVPFTVYLDNFTALSLQRAENTTIGAGPGLTPDGAEVAKFWKNLYVLVARANSVLDGSKDYVDDLGDRSLQYIAEVRVLRAFAYYYLIATWGDVIFFRSPVTVEQYEDSRTDRTVIMDFILDELDLAAEKLPWKATERGRVDKSFAYGLKARAALMAGSLNFGGKGSSYFRTAADAAAQVIGQRSLAVNFPDLFTLAGQDKADVKDELIFEHIYSNSGTRKFHQCAFGHVSRNTGQTARHPAMLLADTYECIDGKRIDESPLYNPKKPQENRDPRFGWTLWMHGDTVSVNNGSVVTQVLEAYESQTMFYNYTTKLWEMRNNADINSAAAWTSFVNAGVGYIWAKYSSEISEPIASQTCNIAILRYAEILLTYAEAKIELNELDSSVYEAINAVRNRAGMPNVSSDRIGNQQKMRQLVRRERKVELILEGQHFVDMKRWGIGDLENDQPSYGLPLPEIRYEGLQSTDIPNFKKSERHDLNDIASYDAYKEKLKVRDVNRYWNDRYLLWPIPQLEKDQNPNLGQNPGY